MVAVPPVMQRPAVSAITLRRMINGHEMLKRTVYYNLLSHCYCFSTICCCFCYC